VKHPRIAIGALSLSAAALVALWDQEGWTERAVIPVKGDVPTVGPGLTKRADGSPVQMGDTIKPLEGIRRSLAHVQKDEAGLKACITAPLYQAEWDILVDAAYQYGPATVCKSSMVRRANAGDYRGSCEAYLMYRFVAGRDCALPGSGCRGVAIRAQKRRDACMAVQ
jgi:lysozyme